jgi:hypothetical protein
MVSPKPPETVPNEVGGFGMWSERSASRCSDRLSACNVLLVSNSVHIRQSI